MNSPEQESALSTSLTRANSNLPRPLRSSRRPLGQRLVEGGLISSEQLNHSLEVQSRTKGTMLGQILVNLGYISAPQIGKILEEVTGIAYISLSATSDDPAMMRILPANMIRERLILPVRADEENIWLAMVDPLDLDTIDMVRLQTGKRVTPLLALLSDLLAAINRMYGVQERAEQVLQELTSDGDVTASDDPSDLAREAENAPIVRLVNTVIDGAFDAGASDIHIEPQEDGLRVRYRIDGILNDQMRIPRSSMGAVVSRIKVIGGMDIAERRRPQDGRISRNYQNRNFDLRVSTMPTVFGEKVVLRVLDKSVVNVALEQIGFLPDELERWTGLIARPYGVVLVTGPTGSGKSTTLYASLNRINDPGLNISTVEDPVEYQLRGINQTQVNPRAGITFASGLRTLMRQDPDIILVGEIRDRETAEVTINAALTGHLVFATLHTNDAPGAVTRLENMGIEPFLIASSLLGVTGQRLLRKICEACKEWYVPHPSLLTALGLPEENEGQPVRFARGKGCRECRESGYRGRTAVFEIMTASDTIRTLILEHQSSDTIKRQAIQEGMRPMRQSGLEKVLRGMTTPEEVARVILNED